MAATIRDWQAHGVALKVELAISGSLVLGGNQTDFPFVQGGSNGAPQGWTPAEYFSGPADNVSAYSFSTSAGGIFSVTPVSTSARSAGIWSAVFPVTPGKRYAIIGQARQMASKTTSHKVVRIDTGPTLGTITDYYTGVTGAAQNDWEDIVATGVAPVPAGHIYGTIMILGSPAQSGVASAWGVEFQSISIKELADTPEPIEWVDVSCDVQSIAVRYGRERFTNRYDVSTMQLDLLNTTGKYSFHTEHPLGLKPGRQVRVTATYQGIDYPLAFHVIDSMVDAYGLDGSVVSRWSCVDPTTTLAQAEVASTVAPGMKAGSRIGYLLDQVGYYYRALDPGVWNVQKITANGRTIRDEAGVTADSEGGNFFADRLGNVVYKDRTWPTVDPQLMEVTADLVAYPHEGVMPIVDDVPTQEGAPLICVNELTTDWSLARVINWVSLANAGGTAKTYIDDESLQAYGPHTYSRHDFVLTSSSFLDTRAADIMTGYSQPVLRVNSIAYAPGMSGAWEFTFSLFLNWLVRVWYSHPINYWGYAVCVHVQSIEHRITPTDWLTTLTVDLPESFVELVWAIGYGWDDGLWDENLWDQSETTIAGMWNEPATLWSSDDNWGA